MLFFANIAVMVAVVVAGGRCSSLSCGRKKTSVVIVLYVGIMIYRWLCCHHTHGECCFLQVSNTARRREMLSLEGKEIAMEKVSGAFACFTQLLGNMLGNSYCPA